MSFKLLKKLIAHLKKAYRCPGCKSFFPDDSIYTLATTPDCCDKTCAGLFYLICPTCPTQAFVFVEVSHPTLADLKKEFIRIRTKPAGNISINEVLDMRNFLRSWQGDVKELFAKEI